MKIIVEGPDGSGKSTLVRRMTLPSTASTLKLELMPRACTSEGGPVDELAQWTIDDLGRSSEGRLELHDRYPLFSEMIYGPITRGKLATLFDTEWHDLAMSLLRDNHQAVLVWCLPPRHMVIDNVLDEDKAKHMEGVAEQIGDIWDAYQAMIKYMVGLWGADRNVIWNYFGGNWPTFLAELETKIAHTKKEYA